MRNHLKRLAQLAPVFVFSLIAHGVVLFVIAPYPAEVNSQKTYALRAGFILICVLGSRLALEVIRLSLYSAFDDIVSEGGSCKEAVAKSKKKYKNLFALAGNSAALPIFGVALIPFIRSGLLAGPAVIIVCTVVLGKTTLNRLFDQPSGDWPAAILTAVTLISSFLMAWYAPLLQGMQ